MRITEPEPVMMTQPEAETAAAKPADAPETKAAATAAAVSVLDALDKGCTADELKEILNSGADMNQKDAEGNTPLIKAAEGEAELAEVLCGAGAKLDEQNEEG